MTHHSPWAAAAATILLLLAAGCTTLDKAMTETPQAAAAASSVAASAAQPTVADAAQPASAPIAVAAAASAAADPPIVEPRGYIDVWHDPVKVDLWHRVRAGFAMADLDSDLVRKWEQWYARDPAYVQRMAERGGRYLFHIAEEIERREMPTELALLPFIESAFNPQAKSRASASGMWQFMPATGKDFALRQNLFRDDRRSVLDSTRAALDYLQKLHVMFGDWHLALAAYNWGQGNVQKAIDRNRRAGLPVDYQSLSMPQETRDYGPKLQAVKNIVLRPDAFGLALPRLDNHPYFVTVTLTNDIDVELAVRLSGMTLETFQQLNPQLNKPVILAAGTSQVLLPYDNANQFLAALAAHRGALASWTAWVAPRTVSVADAAKLIGMPESQLREVNQIPPRMRVKAGSTLLVPRGQHATANVADHIAHHAALDLAPEARPLRRVAFKAGRKGDSVAAVAKRYRVSSAQVAQWNDVAQNARFKPGASIVVMLPARAAAATRSATTAVPRASVKAAAARERRVTPPSKAAAKSTRSARSASSQPAPSSKNAKTARPTNAAGTTRARSGGARD